MLKETFARRFKELEERFRLIKFEQPESGGDRYVPNGSWQQWATSAQSLVLAVCGERSPHYANYVTAAKTCYGTEPEVKGLGAIFLSAKEDFEGGYIFDVDLRVSGEVFGDFVALARTSLSEKKKDVAAVLACAALEDALKKYATANGVDVSGESMQGVVGALKAKGLVAGAQKSLLDAMPKIRNYAMHAEWEKITEPDVNSVIGFVEQFLLSNFNRG